MSTTSSAPKPYAPQGHWGSYRLDPFLDEFLDSRELAQIESDPQARRSLIEALRENPSLTPATAPALLGRATRRFASRTIPHRAEVAGCSSVYSASRNQRDGAQPAIPTAGSDVFASIIAGDEAKGPAIFAAFDRDSSFPLDDLRTAEARACAVPSDVAAVCAVNRFTAYVREMEPDLVVLLEKVKFVRPVRGSGEPHRGKRTIPFGFNLVTFPVEFYSSLAAVPIPVLFAMLQATQRALARVAGLGL